MRIRFRPIKAAGLFALAAAISLAAGCAAGGTGQNSMNKQNYSNDGYLGTTNANPHIPGPNMALTNANDTRLMQDVLRGIHGVNGFNVTFNGADAYVTLKISPGLDSRRIPTIERQAAAALRYNFPRYNVHVKSMVR